MAISPFAQDLIRRGLTRLAGLPGDIARTQESATREQFEQAQDDWRVRLSLAPQADYLYRATDPGILKPLAATSGVIFPYTPQITTTYQANYDPTDLVHSNYKVYQYKNSAIDTISITATFTAQDTYEANYLLAVLHFFKSVTKMFYGQDENPTNGSPPPVCFLSGFGTYQFNNHPLVITNFTQTLPDKVDYIRAQLESPPIAPNNNEGQNKDGNRSGGTKNQPNFLQQAARLGLSLLSTGGTLMPGGKASPPVFSPPRPGKFADATYVPTEIQIQLSAVPVQSRKTISNDFSLKDYANGSLIKKGIW